MREFDVLNETYNANIYDAAEHIERLLKERDEAKRWAQDAEVTANEMAEESGAVVEQLQQENRALEANLRGNDKVIEQLQESVESARKGCEKYRKERDEWKREAQLAHEEIKRMNKTKKEMDHICKQHSMIYWGPGVNNIREVVCMECGAKLYDATKR